MVTRKKVDAEPVMKSWGEIEDALIEIKKIDNEVAKTEAHYDNLITDMKGDLAIKTEDQLKRKARLEKDLEEFAEEHKDEVRSEKMARTKELNNGLLGYRWTPWSIKIVKKKKDEVIALIKKARLHTWIRTKEEVDKEAVMKSFDAGKADNGKLAKVCLKRDRKEEFWYTTDKTRAINAEAEVTKLKDVA